MRITFLGGVGTVTGSKYLLDFGHRRVLVDCGLFQGYKQLRLRNWAPPPVRPRSVGTVVLTHAHLDHSGYLPVFVRNGFEGPVLSTPATRDLCAILLPDSGHLQEREAEFANRHGFTRHRPARPLYTQREAIDVLDRFRPVPFERTHRIGREIELLFRPSGHILGAALVRLEHRGRSILFTGDLGRAGDPVMVDPAVVRRTDYLVVESTYGNRRHEGRDPEDALEEIINRTVARGGTVLIPAFAVGRAQQILYHLHRLKAERRIPDVPVFLDSPMAIDASQIFRQYVREHRLSPSECYATCHVAKYVRTAEESKALDRNRVPMVLISASGMATGGRVLHHLKVFAPDPRSTILFVGYQAGGTRGAAMTAGASAVKIHGGYVPVRAEVENLHMMSAHADADGILAWLGKFERPPKATFVTHGEPAASDALRHRIEEELGWRCRVPEYLERATLD